MFNKLTKDFVLYTVGPQIPRVINFLLLPLYTQYLTSFDYGITGIIYSYMGIVGGLADLGLSIRFSITYFKYPKTWQNRWPMLSGILFWWSILFSFLQLGLLWIVLPDDMGATKLTVILLNFCTSIFFASWNTLCISLMQFKQKSVTITTINVLIGVAAIILNYVFIIHLRLGYIGWFYTTFITSVVQGLFSLYWLFVHSKVKVDFSLRFRTAFKILAITLPLVFHNYSNYLLNSSDRVILKYLKVPIAQIGVYNFAYIFAAYFEFITTAVGIASGPLFAKNFYSKSPLKYQHNKNLIVFFQVIFIMLAFSISVLIKDFLHVFVNNKELWNCNYLVCILVFAYCYKPIYWYVNSILSYNNKTGNLWMMTFTSGVVNVILNILLIPYLGIYACALSTLVCLLFMTLLGSSLKNFRQLNKEPFNFLSWIAIIVTMCAISLFLQDQPIFIKIIVLIITNLLAARYVYSFYVSKIKVIQI